MCLKRNDPGSFRCRLFGEERFLKHCSMTFYFPDIVILEIIFYRGTYDLDWKIKERIIFVRSLIFHANTHFNEGQKC